MGIPFQSLTVFCGARSGANPEFEKLAYELGQWLAINKINLVYGGGSVGLMGALARGAFENGGYIVGVIPEALKARELEFKEAHELIVVQDMHQRKATMSLRGDAFLTLPGGFGTLEEIFEMITWRQLGFHQKPLYFLNSHDYFLGLKNFIHHMSQEKFISPEDMDLLEFFSGIESWKTKWKK
ncbi:MAG: TIGR00730 family Rossman fold protein [Bdellovibrionales bacterium]